MLIKKRLNNSMKNFTTFKPKNQSIFYDICIRVLDKNNEKLPDKDSYIKEIKNLKKSYLSRWIIYKTSAIKKLLNKNKKKVGKKFHFQKTILLSHKSIDDIIKESRAKHDLKKENEKSVDINKKTIILPKMSLKKEQIDTIQKIKKFFHGKNKRYTIYKHITEYLESNNITIDELIVDNPFQSKPLIIPGSNEFLEAVKFNAYECVKNMLKKNNKLLFAIDYFGQTAYHWAAKFSDIKMMEILISFGMHHIQKDFKGRTPLYLAAFNNKKDMCKYLLKNHANPFLKDKNGKSPADVAGSLELKYLLEDHMSMPFNNPVFKLKIKKILAERKGYLLKDKKSSSKIKFVSVADQLYDINKHYK